MLMTLMGLFSGKEEEKEEELTSNMQEELSSSSDEPRTRLSDLFNRTYIRTDTKAEDLLKIMKLPAAGREGPGDALRHAAAAAFTARQYGETPTRNLGELNEMFSLKESTNRIQEGKSREEYRPFATEADLKVNDLGMEAARNTANDQEALAYILDKMIESNDQDSFWGPTVDNDRMDPNVPVPWNRQKYDEQPEEVLEMLQQYRSLLSPTY